MIETWQALLLALLQGFTEFLPISSSAHLVFPSLLLGWPDQGLAFDVAVHVGTLLAVILYYRRDLLAMAGGCLLAARERRANDDARLVLWLALATLPACVVGFLGKDFIETHLRSLPVIATTTLVFGLLLGLAEWHARRSEVRFDKGAGSDGARPLGLQVALLVGLAQALAPVPGVSRSGITLTAGLLLGLSRQAAARLSFLLSIPVIAGAGLLKTLDLIAAGGAVNWGQLALASLTAGLVAYACIAVFLRLLDRVGLMPFVWYLLVLAGLLYAVWLKL